MMSMTNLDDSTWIHTSMKEHKEIIDALEKKDGSAVERLIAESCHSCRQDLHSCQLTGRKAGEERFSLFETADGSKKEATARPLTKACHRFVQFWNAFAI